MSSPTSPQQRDDASVQLARITFRQAVLVAFITAGSGLLGALIQNRSTSAKVEGLEASAKVSEDERAALYLLTSEALESDLSLTQGKAAAVRPEELPPSELDYRRLRRAVFLNMVPLRANATILENTLQALINQGREWVKAQKSRVVSDFPEIEKARLVWLKDVAIPQLQQAIDSHSMASQMVPSAVVPLPETAWILPQGGEKPTVTVTSMSALKEEAELLQRSLSPSP